MDKSLNKKLVEKRIYEFLGYGDLSGEIWFIGKEEGSSNEFEELFNRFKITENKEVIDLRSLKTVPEHMKWFEGDSPKLQRTWDKLIQILLMRQDSDYKLLEKRREFQKNKLGCISGNHCLIEFSSLPSTSTGTWVYDKYCPELSYLTSRNKYLKEIIPERIKLIAKKIKYHKPKIVIFYSISKVYIECWNKIINLVNDKSINFIIIPHPVARVSKEAWKNIFKEIKNF